MGETYKGVTVPLSTDFADGPKFTKEMVDTLPASEAFATLTTQLTQALVPAGTLRACVNAGAEPGWATMGATLTGAQTQYPNLWAAVPSSWKSGANINLPSMANHVAVGGTLGATIGGPSNLKQITVAQLPGHTHGIDHSHGALTASIPEDVYVPGAAGTPGAFLYDAGVNANIYFKRPAVTGFVAPLVGGASASTGSGNSLDITPLGIGVVWKIKAH